MGSLDSLNSQDSVDAIVREVVGEAHVRLEELRPEDKAFLQDHALKKPLRVLDIWALGVGVVITGAYFGWNVGLEDNGPVAMLVASLIVCLLYMTWVLTLAELTVAMPFAGGPLAYGRRAFGPLIGFLMGWSMFLECQFATIATALATGGYIAFLFNLDDPSETVSVVAALATILIFLVLHLLGVKEQSGFMVIMTYGAIIGLVLFWILAATNFSWERIWPKPLFPPEKNWKAVLDAVPYALWWLVMIETVALAAEEAHEPHRTIPRGLIWGQLTLIALVLLTWLFACGAVDSQSLVFSTLRNEDGTLKRVDYPLAQAIRLIPVGKSLWIVYGFGIIAVFGMIASYHGMIYGTSRQAFALGHAGYLPAFLGRVHGAKRTPAVSLVFCSLLTAVFVVARLKYKEAIEIAVLVSTLTALAWYILAMLCLFVLRKREPYLFKTYRAPLVRTLPVVVILMSLLCIVFYATINSQVIPFTLALYVGALAYYWLWAHKRIQKAAPEELGAKQTSLVRDGCS